MGTARNRKHLGEILVVNKLVTEEQLDSALAEQQKTLRPLGQLLVSKGWISPKLLLQALAAQRGVAAWHLEESPPQPKALATLAVSVCEERTVLPVKIQGDLLYLAMRDPAEIETIDLVRNVTGLRIEPVMADETLLLKAIKDLSANWADGPRSQVDTLVREAVKDFSRKRDQGRSNERQVLTEAEARPVVSLVNQIISEAIDARASDVHIEPCEDRIEVRYRIDGVVHLKAVIPVDLGPALTTRVKIMAEIDIAEHRLPQDGRVAVEKNGREIDLRVNTIPSVFGQRIVLRILDQTIALRELDDLGFTDSNLRLLKTMIQRPYGLFLVTGPTGSGKTTTLYSCLAAIKGTRGNIMTCEDPVEYLIDGISQSQIHEKIGLTFAATLRAMLRQDPDVLLIGEIRDQDTAETAIRASMTGHLVLSTLHTNDALSTLPRLLDMGVEPYLLSTSLIGTMSQRLLRRVCTKCQIQVDPTEEEAEFLATQFGLTQVGPLYRGAGCQVCGGTGFKGRVAVHEVMPVTQDIAHLIACKAPIDQVREVAVQFGYITMQEDAARRVLNGTTTLEEVRRVISFDLVAPGRSRAALKAA
jgi:type IV pilus assembly protein PilB